MQHGDGTVWHLPQRTYNNIYEDIENNQGHSEEILVYVVS